MAPAIGTVIAARSRCAALQSWASDSPSTYSLSALFFFFSSRRRHTRSLCDWSSDVCSSDLAPSTPRQPRPFRETLMNEGETAVSPDRGLEGAGDRLDELLGSGVLVEEALDSRSEERRVGKECRSRWSPYDSKKNERDEEDTG